METPTCRRHGGQSSASGLQLGALRVLLSLYGHEATRLTSKQVAFVGISPADTNDTLTQSKDAALNAASTFNEQLPAPLPATSRRPRTLFAVVAKT